MIGEASYSNIRKSFTSTDVKGFYQTGGLVGTSSYSNISDCFSISKVTGDTYYYGGLVGSISSGSVKNFYFGGQLFSSSNTYQRLADSPYLDIIKNSYYDLSKSTSGLYVKNEQAKTSIEMKDKSTYVDWDFENTWVLDETFEYPYLKDNSQIFGDGLGSVTNPYPIETPEQLKQMANKLDTYYILKADIDLNNEEWIPIGTSATPFTGSLDGNGYKIKNINIKLSAELEKTYTYVGFFGYAKNAIFKNVVLENINISSKTRVGGLAGYLSNCEVTNCSVIGGGILKITSGSISIGGLAGTVLYSNISKSFTSIDVEGPYQTGGLVGVSTSSNITDCFSVSKVTGGSSIYGGLIASIYSGSVKNSYFGGQLFSSSNTYQRLADSPYLDIIKNSYYDLSKSTSGLYVKNEQAKTSIEMKDKSTYVDWDFENTWVLDETFEYPYLKDNSQIFGDGLGSVTNPYPIETPEQLKQMANKLDTYYILKADIDLNNEEWIPIGTSATPFSGSLDGNGYKIKNINIKLSVELEKTYTYVGFFGYAKNAIFKNVVLENINILSKTRVGGLAGYLYNCEVTNCSVIGGGILKITSGSISIGGLAGTVLYSNISKSFTSIDVEGPYQTGGLVGVSSSSNITDCFSVSKVTGGSVYYGGLIGTLSSGSVKNSYFGGQLFGNSNLSQRLASSPYLDIIKTSYYDLSKSTNGLYAQNEQAKTTPQMMTKSTFETIWDIDEGNSYPFLRVPERKEPEETANPNAPLPNNSYPLKWPTQSAEVTLWYGKIHPAYEERHEGIDIQSKEEENVISVSDGIIVRIDRETQFGDIVYVNFGYQGKKMQARYAHLKNTSSLKVGAKITKGETIGTMSFTENENLVEVILYESTNGKNCETKNINKKTVDPSLYLEYQEVPEPDYLHYPMAASLGTSISDSVSGRLAMIVGGDKKSPIMSYIYNEDLGNVKKESAIERSLSVTSNTADENIQDENLEENNEIIESHIRKEVFDAVRIFDHTITNNNFDSKGLLVFDDATKIATVKINGKELQYGSSLGNAKIIDKKMIINANELYNSALTVNVSLNNKIFKIDLTRKEQVLQLLKSFDVNTRVDGKNKNTINVYNYKTKTPVKYEYKRSIKIYDVLTKSGFIYAKTGSACYTEVSKNNYVATVKNIFEHHLGFSETEIYEKVNEFANYDVLFVDEMNDLNNNMDGLYLLYLVRIYQENDLKKIFSDMNYESSFYEKTREMFSKHYIYCTVLNLFDSSNQSFVKTRYKLVELYIKNSAHLTIDNILYGFGYPLPSNQYQNFISVNVNGENIKFDIMDINSVAEFLATYDVNNNSEQSLKSNKLYVYNYKLKKVIGLSYTKQMKFEDLLDYAGFTNTETGIACYTKTGYNSYKVKAENSHLNKIGLTREELISSMKNMNTLDLIFLQTILNKFSSEQWSTDEAFIRWSTIIYVYKTNDKQQSLISDMDFSGLFISDMGLVDEASKIIDDLGYGAVFRSELEISYKASREGISFNELLAMDFLQQKEKIEIAVNFAIANLFMTLGQNIKSPRDKALVKVAETENPGVGEGVKVIKIGNYEIELRENNIVGTDYDEVRPTQDWINMQQVDDYVERLKKGEKLSSIEIYEVPGKGFYIQDGHHRFVASQITGIPVDVIFLPGSGPTGWPNWIDVLPGLPD